MDRDERGSGTFFSPRNRGDIADEQSSGADYIVAETTDGVDLERDAGGLAGEVIGGDFTRENI